MTILKINGALVVCAVFASVGLWGGDEAMAAGKVRISPTPSGFRYTSPSLKRPTFTQKVEVAPIDAATLRVTTYPHGVQKVEIAERVQLEGRKNRVDMTIAPSSNRALIVERAGNKVQSSTRNETQVPHLDIEHMHAHLDHCSLPDKAILPECRKRSFHFLMETEAGRNRVIVSPEEFPSIQK
jgi:hypothetical protein